jgi:imidazolonepropionase-like amidohydrolase
MTKRIALSAVFAGFVSFVGFVRADQVSTAPVYAVRGAKIVSAAGAPIDKGNLVMRNGFIADVGANAAIPDDAVVIDGTGMTAYPGLIDMSNSSAVESTAGSGAGAAGSGTGGRGSGAAAGGQVPAPAPTWADLDRTRREALLNPDFDAARHVRHDGAEMYRLASAGITSVLAVPASGLFRGQSAFINVLAAPDPDEISRVAGYRRGSVVLKPAVAQHVSFNPGSGGRGSGGYPGAPLGMIAFVRQSLYDAQWQKDARAFAEKHKDQPRMDFEPALDALAPALDGRMPVSFDAGEVREILRALAMAKEFKLDPIITGGVEAAETVADLTAAKARVILTLTAGGGAGGGRGGGGRSGGDTPIRVTRMQQAAPKNAAALEKAGILYAFSSEGLQNPTDFVRGVSRAIREGGLTPDQAIRALTVNAARMAGVQDRVGTIEKGKIANVIVTEGDLFAEGTRIRRVFIDGRVVDIR